MSKGICASGRTGRPLARVYSIADATMPSLLSKYLKALTEGRMSLPLPAKIVQIRNLPAGVLNATLYLLSGLSVRVYV